jgi:hypothetical protein
MNAPAPIAAATCRFALEGESGGPLCHCAGVSEASVRGAIDFRGVSTIECGRGLA